MRVYMRDKIDVSQNIDLAKLSPLQQVLASIQYQWRETEYYKRKQAKKAQIAMRKQLEREEKLKDYIQTVLMRDLIKNKNSEVRSRRAIATKIGLAIDRQFEDIIDEVLHAKGFEAFNIEKIEEHPDVLKAQPNLPIRVEFSKKVL